jgi:hypothetical protein
MARRTRRDTQVLAPTPLRPEGPEPKSRRDNLTSQSPARSSQFTAKSVFVAIDINGAAVGNIISPTS